jgi:NAD(P)-dependent dehydrogenase (short-subunit alcohol dehydrogenase family)
MTTQTVIITGGATGLGYAMAEVFLHNQCDRRCCRVHSPWQLLITPPINSWEHTRIMDFKQESAGAIAQPDRLFTLGFYQPEF